VSRTTLLLVRHGDAGHDNADPGLSAEGVKQAHAVGARLAGSQYTGLVHSPKRRATETTNIMSEYLPGVPVSESSCADDRTPIPLDWTSAPSRYHEFLRSVPELERDVGGKQLDIAIAEFSRVHDEERRLIVVTHNFVIGWFVRSALDAPSWRWLGLNQDNGAVTTIEYRRGHNARLVSFNDVGHLAAFGPE
jgi:serine/threonine-protein phosphatase PGAM5